MNKAIVKHERRSMKWSLLAFVIVSLLISILFKVNIESKFAFMIRNGVEIDSSVVLDSFREILPIILITFSILSMIQIYSQFNSEKNREVGRFMKSLPIQEKEFFMIKLIEGLKNILIAFAILFIGILVIRKVNMFWIEDIYSISLNKELFISLDGIFQIIKELGLVLLIIIGFYTFLFMIQYTFTNTVGAIVTGVLIWLAPIFIGSSIIFLIGKLLPEYNIYNSSVFLNINNNLDYLQPLVYPFGYKYMPLINSYGHEMSYYIIDRLMLKYIINIIIIVLSTIVAYKFSQNKKIENEDRIISFEISRKIFVFGVTICSGLALGLLFDFVLLFNQSRLFFIISIIIGAFIGYLISKKIVNIGSKKEV